MNVISQSPIVSGLELENSKLNKLSQSAEKAAGSFQKFFSQAINNVQDLQSKADGLTKSLATGEINDIHQVMIAAEKASLALQFTVQVRNKVIDAYQEVMRMQI